MASGMLTVMYISCSVVMPLDSAVSMAFVVPAPTGCMARVVPSSVTSATLASPLSDRAMLML